MSLNLNFYKGKDEYSEGNIEDDIIEYITKNTLNNYNAILEQDDRWSVYFHLSPIRKNILSWYPFEKNSSILEIGAGMGAITELLCQKAKNVTCVELSKRRATAIKKRCNKYNNIEILVGNFNDIKFKEKYDYITLIGVLEYASSFTNTDNPMYDFLNKIKSLLKPNGKILIAIENRFGIKYLCGAKEDHTLIPYSGIYNYPNINNVKTLSKSETQELLQSLDLKYNFFYCYPDYKFPEIIMTDNYKPNLYDLKYTPYYSTNSFLSIDEISLYKQFSKEYFSNDFANSFFIEVSQKSMKNEYEYIKFNNCHRKPNFQLGTIIKENEVIKYPLCDEAIPFLNQVFRNHESLDKKNYTSNLKNNQLLFPKIKYKKMIDEILKSQKAFEYYFDKLINYIKKSSSIKFDENNIFNKFNINISEKELKSMKFLKKGYIDLTFFNAFILDNDQLLFIDQEWVFDYVPIEFIIYRNIRMLSLISKNINTELIIKKYNLNNKVFQTLENEIQKHILKKKEKFISSLVINDVNEKLKEQDAKIELLENELNAMKNSRSWKITKPLRNIKNKVRKTSKT